MPKNGAPSAEISRSVPGLGGCQWQALPSPVQCEKTATRTRDLPVTGGKTLPLAPGPAFKTHRQMVYHNYQLEVTYWKLPYIYDFSDFKFARQGYKEISQMWQYPNNHDLIVCTYPVRSPNQWFLRDTYPPYLTHKKCTPVSNPTSIKADV